MTNTEMLAATVAAERLARIETKIDRLLDDRIDHEKRLRAVEKKVYWFSGAAAVVGALASKLPLPWH